MCEAQFDLVSFADCQVTNVEIFWVLEKLTGSEYGQACSNVIALDDNVAGFI